MLFLAVGVWIGLVSFISLHREYMGFGAETDFLGGFLPEARRILSGEPLGIEFHPPFYSAVLALFQFFIDDWFLSGRLLSLLAYTVALLANFFLFRSMISPVAGWGALLALMASTPLVYFTGIASSDVFFFALYSISIMTGMMALRKNSPSLWLATGIFVSLVLLSRTNGFTLALLMFLPWLSVANSAYKSKMSLLVLTGVMIPLLVWAVIANYTGSPFMPSGTYANLALTYFSPSGSPSSGYDRVLLEAKFNNIWEVLAYDPGFIFKSYFVDLYKLMKTIFMYNRLMEFSVSWLLLPAMIILILRREKAFIFYAFILTLSQILLVNFKGYEVRFYLFVIPAYGVALAIVVETLSAAISKVTNSHYLRSSELSLMIIFLVFVYPVFHAYKSASLRHLASDAELADLIGPVESSIAKNSILVASLPQVSFYVKSDLHYFPAVKSLAELRKWLNKLPKNRPVYVLYGTQEKKHIPTLQDLLSHDRDRLTWLPVIIKSSKKDKWVLYKFTG